MIVVTRSALLATLLVAAAASWSQEPDEFSEARAAFERALAAQKSGDAESAIAAYHEVLALKPDSAATYNNLAKLYEKQGNQDEALRNYRKAVAIDDKNQPFYREQYAKALEAAGNQRGAVTQYERIAREMPESVTAQRNVVNFYLAQAPDNGDAFAKFLWNKLRQGQALSTAQAALRGLQTGRYPTRFKFELVAIVGAAMGTTAVTAEESETLMSALAELDDEVLNACVSELASLRAQPGGEYPWWSRRGSVRREAERGVWPRDAFRAVARKLGWRAEVEGDYERAEAYYRTAAFLVADELDPKAFEFLVKLYSRRGQLDRLDKLVRDSETLNRLFEGKGEAYRRGHLEKIYQYHVTLGYLFGNLARRDPRWWGDSSTPASAVFQLERAMEVGRQIDEGSSGRTPPGTRGDDVRSRRAGPHVDVGVVNLLSEYYDRNEEGRSQALRVETAARLKAADKTAAARQVLKPVSNVELKDVEAIRLPDRNRIPNEPNRLDLPSAEERRDLTRAELIRARQRQEARDLVEASRRQNNDG